jgi:ATP-dependent Clp protease ATP-binding subunit ClpA
MFERFTDRARRVVVLAQQEAQLLNHSYIGTEHLLLGLLADGGGIAAQALESLGVTLEAAQQQVREIIGEGEQPQQGHIPFTPRAKKVLELSLREALNLGDDHIGTEHLLLGLLEEADGVGAQVVARLGASRRAVRDKVIELTGAVPDPAALEAGSWTRSVRIRADALNEVRELLASVDRRLSAIERHLGIAAAAGEPADPQTAVPDELQDPEAAAPDEPQDPPAAAPNEPEDPQATAE